MASQWNYLGHVATLLGVSGYKTLDDVGPACLRYCAKRVTENGPDLTIRIVREMLRGCDTTPSDPDIFSAWICKNTRQHGKNFGLHVIKLSDALAKVYSVYDSYESGGSGVKPAANILYASDLSLEEFIKKKTNRSDRIVITGKF